MNKIAIIEDDIDICNMIAKFLENNKYIVHYAYQTHTLKNLLTVFLHNRQGSTVSFPATPYACKRAGRKCIHSRLLPAYP